MTFAEPVLLLALLAVPAALARATCWCSAGATGTSSGSPTWTCCRTWSRVRPSWRRHVPVALYLAAVAALAIALASPSMVVAVPREEATVILTMDTSRSMLATDVDPNRMTAAKAGGDRRSSTSCRPGSRSGLVAFSTEARLVLAPTTDRSQVEAAINGLRADGGTALGDAIDLSLQAAGLTGRHAGQPGRRGLALARPRPRPIASASPAPSAGTDDQGTPLVAMVLLSDGKSSTGQMDPLDAADEAAAAGVPGLHDRPRHGRRHGRRPGPVRPDADDPRPARSRHARRRSPSRPARASSRRRTPRTSRRSTRASAPRWASRTRSRR